MNPNLKRITVITRMGTDGKSTAKQLTGTTVGYLMDKQFPNSLRVYADDTTFIVPYDNVLSLEVELKLPAVAG